MGYAHYHLRRLPVLLAEDQLDAAQVAQFPNLSAEGQRSWYRQVRRQASKREDEPERTREVITMNGRILRDARRIKASFKRTFGGLFGTGDR